MCVSDPPPRREVSLPEPASDPHERALRRIQQTVMEGLARAGEAAPGVMLAQIAAILVAAGYDIAGGVTPYELEQFVSLWWGEELR